MAACGVAAKETVAGFAREITFAGRRAVRGRPKACDPGASACAMGAAAMCVRGDPALMSFASVHETVVHPASDTGDDRAASR